MLKLLLADIISTRQIAIECIIEREKCPWSLSSIRETERNEVAGNPFPYSNPSTHIQNSKLVSSETTLLQQKQNANGQHDKQHVMKQVKGRASSLLCVSTLDAWSGVVLGICCRLQRCLQKRNQGPKPIGAFGVVDKSIMQKSKDPITFGWWIIFPLSIYIPRSRRETLCVVFGCSRTFCLTIGLDTIYCSYEWQYHLVAFVKGQTAPTSNGIIQDIATRPIKVKLLRSLACFGGFVAERVTVSADFDCAEGNNQYTDHPKKWSARVLITLFFVSENSPGPSFGIRDSACYDKSPVAIIVA